METPNYYAIIPANVRYCKAIPSAAKLLYGEITALCNEKGYCWATNEYFAELYNKDVKTISRWIAALVKKQFIRSEISKEEGNKRRLYIEYPIRKNEDTLPPKMSIATPKNVPYNNTYNNTEEKQLEQVCENTNLPSQEEDCFHEKYQLRFSPATLADAKEKLTLYYETHSLEKETEGKCKQEQFSEIRHSFLTKRVEGEYKKRFNSFLALHDDFIAWAKRHTNYKTFSSNGETKKEEKLPHREAAELSDEKLTSYLEKIGKNNFTASRVKNRIAPYMEYIKERAARLVVVSRLAGLSESDVINLLCNNHFNKIEKTGTGKHFYDAIDQIPNREDLKQCASIAEVIQVFFNTK